MTFSELVQAPGFFNPIAQLCRMAVVAGGTVAGSVVVGAETDLDMVGAKYTAQAMLTASGNGAIKRDFHDMGSLTSPGAQTITPPFPSGTTYHVSSEPTPPLQSVSVAKLSQVSLLPAPPRCAAVFTSLSKEIPCLIR